jgi:exopolysaccharide biosynthesis polyprenyl glycosylphosphotransferase
VKRTLDLILSTILLLLLSPVMLICSLAVRVGSSGPVLYRQERMGRDRRVFKILKFRSMVHGAEASTGPVWAATEDPRRTAVGEFLRKWSLDELPQLWNVFRGDMSLVGPRPERPHFVEQFHLRVPGYYGRHRIKAGLTGWAQVNGLRGNVPIEERTRYDLYYIENWTLWLDLKILFLTLRAVISHRGA